MKEGDVGMWGVNHQLDLFSEARNDIQIRFSSLAKVQIFLLSEQALDIHTLESTSPVLFKVLKMVLNLHAICTVPFLRL